jgi:hypothetical protein
MAFVYVNWSCFGNFEINSSFVNQIPIWAAYWSFILAAELAWMRVSYWSMLEDRSAFLGVEMTDIMLEPYGLEYFLRVHSVKT